MLGFSTDAFDRVGPPHKKSDPLHSLLLLFLENGIKMLWERQGAVRMVLDLVREVPGVG